jgi:rare lipoprotein A
MRAREICVLAEKANARRVAMNTMTCYATNSRQKVLCRPLAESAAVVLTGVCLMAAALAMNYKPRVAAATHAATVREQIGTASWYGRGFHGRTTANGERFNQYQLTAAHRTLPLGTIADVVNMENGKTVRVRINDRGPYIGERVIDLSLAAARRLGMIEQGLARVRVKAVAAAPSDRSAAVR